MKIVGVAGIKKSGKDTFADILLENVHGVKIAFADPLKRMLLPLGFPKEILWGPSELRDEWKHPLLGITARKALQTVGDSVGRQLLSLDLWVVLARNTVKEFLAGKLNSYIPWEGGSLLLGSDPVKLLILSDMRYRNEHGMVKSLGGTTFLVERPEVESGDPHISEQWCRDQARNEVDHRLSNSSSFEDFKYLAQKTFESYIRPEQW